MTGRERVMTALNLGEPDTVPVWEMGFNEPPITGIAKCLAEQGRLPDAASRPGGLHGLLETLIAFAEALDVDGVTATSSAPWEKLDEMHRKDALGVVYHVSDHGAPFPVDGPIKEKSDLKTYRMREPQEADFRGLDTFRSTFPDKAVAFHMPATFKLSWGLRGTMQQLLIDYLLDPDLAHQLARMVTDYCLEVVEIAFERGADFIACEGDLAHNPGSLMSPDHYDEFIGPYHTEICARVHAVGGKIIKHSDGNLTPLVPALLDAGFDGIHPIQPQCMDIGQTKSDFGERACVLGNIDCGFLLVEGTPAEVRENVRDTIAQAAPGGGYIISSSNSIHPGCKPENYVAMVDAAREFGSYPISV